MSADPFPVNAMDAVVFVCGNATQVVSFGGGSFIGRFMWPTVPLLLILAAATEACGRALSIGMPANLTASISKKLSQSILAFFRRELSYPCAHFAQTFAQSKNLAIV